MLRLKSLGQTLIEADDARLTPAAETVFAVALYLIVEAGRPVGRDELTSLLWSGVSEARAQHGLRQALYRLKILGATIRADRSSLILSPRFCATDFAPIVTPQPIATLEQFAETIEGSFLPGYNPQLSEAFTTWVDRQRDVVHSAVARTLVAGMQAKKRVSDWGGAERLASICLSIDPLNEEATLTLAEAAALGGSKTKALSILNHYLIEIGDGAGEIKLPAALLRRRISEAYSDIFLPVRDVPFTGREGEMAELTSALSGARSGRGMTYLMVGEPGIGKTRLVSEFTRVTSLQRIQIVRVGCQPQDVRRPMSTFVDLVPRLLSLPGALGCSPDSMRCLRRLTAHDPDEALARGESEVPEISYSTVRKAFMDVLDAISAESQALIEIEDAQWLDRQSTQLLEELSDWIITRRVLFLVTSRRSILAGENVRSLFLRPLQTAASRTIAMALASTSKMTGNDFLSWCVSSSGGNPYYLIELIRNGTQRRNGYQAPESLTRLLQNRVSALSEEARSLLQACCVLGKHSTVHRVEASIAISRIALLRALSELDASGMIEVDGSRIICRHDLLTSAVLVQMSAAAQMMLHRFAAAQLEAEADISRSVSLIWDSAEHWLSAADSARAVLLLRRCGNHLLDLGMPSEAVQVLERAEGLATTAADQYQIGAELVRALLRTERPFEAVKVIDRLQTLRVNIHPSPSPLDELSVMSLQARWENGGSIPEIVRDGLFALSSKFATDHERISAASWLMSAADNLCDLELGRDIYARVSPHLSSSDVAIDTRLWFEMVYNASCGDRELARGFASELIEHARRHSPPLVAIKHLRHGAHVLSCFGATHVALPVMMESFEWAKNLNASVSMAVSAGLLSSFYMHNGDNNCAKTWIDSAFAAHTPAVTSVADMNMWSYRAEVSLRLRDVVDAELCLSNCLPGVESAKSARSLARYLSLESQLLLLTGREICSTSIKSLISLHDATKRSLVQDYTVESLLQVLEAANRLGDAARITAGYVYQFRRPTGPLSVPLAAIIARLGLLSDHGD